LLVERHRVSATIEEARLHQVAIAPVAAGRAGDAIPHASRAVALNPLEEGNHELLIRSWPMAGDRAAAEQQMAVRCARTYCVVSSDVALQAPTLAAIGSALVHAVRGRDGEGAIVLQEAILLADPSG
jgi:hypothetical protein